MSAVVLSELYAGAHDSQSIKLLDKLNHTSQSVGRLVVPDGRVWRQTGIIIARLRKKYGFEARYLSRIQNDILNEKGLPENKRVHRFSALSIKVDM